MFGVKLPAIALGLLAVCTMLPLAQAQDNITTGERINGYTGVTFDTRGYAYDYLVDSSIAQDDPASKKFKTLQAAYAAAPAGTPEKPTVIGIKPDVYFLRGGDTTAGLTITKNYITLLGLTDDRRKVVLADNRGHMKGAIDNGYVITANADGFTVMNLTVVNYCNLDYEYPGDPAKDLKMRSPFDAQAVAMSMRGDKHVYSHVAFLGRHDTLFIQTTRAYFTHVYVEGTEDFLGGPSSGSNVWEDSEVYFPAGHGVMIVPGTTFIRTVFKSSHGLAFDKALTAPTTLIDCVLPVNTPQSPSTWLLGKIPSGVNFYFLTYHTKDARGNPAVIYDSNVGPPSFKLSRELTDQEAAAFNSWNLLRGMPSGVADDWDPAGVKEKYAQQGNAIFRMALTADPPAAGGKTPDNRPFQSISQAVHRATIHTGGPTKKLSVVAYPARAQNSVVTWSTNSDAIVLDKTTGPAVVVTANNKSDHTVFASVKATAPNGFFITVPLMVEPAYNPAPKFVKTPAVYVVPGKATVSYTFSPEGAEDRSNVTWYLCDDAPCAVRRAVAVSRGDQPLKEYESGAGAIGKYVEAEVQLKRERSEPGPVATAISAKAVAAGDVLSATVSPNFRNFVETANDTYANGMWTVLGTWQTVTNENLAFWESPNGEDLLNGYGIRVASRGADLLYQNDTPTGDMQVTVTMTPEKKTGEGFGSPGSSSDDPNVQHGDIFIKYDPRTKTGYSLRFWHTLYSEQTCMFQLFKIENGKGTPISDQQQLTGVFKPTVTFVLSIAGSTFTARGANTMDSETVSLQGTVIPNRFGGSGVHWSGTVYIGNSVSISKFEISYPNTSSK